MSRVDMAPLARGRRVHEARPHALAWMLALAGCSLVTAVPDDSTQPSGAGAAPTSGGGGTGGDGGIGASGVSTGGGPAVTTTATGGGGAGGASCQPGELRVLLAETQDDSVTSIYDIELTHDDGLVLWGAHEAGDTLFGQVVPGAGFFISRVTSDLVPATNPPPTTNVPFTVFDVEPYFTDGKEGVWVGGNIVDTATVPCLTESMNVQDDPGIVAQYSLGASGFGCSGLTTISPAPPADNTYPLRGLETSNGGLSVDVLTQLPFAASGVHVRTLGAVEYMLPGASRLSVTSIAAAVAPSQVLVTDDDVAVMLPGGDRGPARTTIPYPPEAPSSLFFSAVDIGDGARRIYRSDTGPSAAGLAISIPPGLFLWSGAIDPAAGLIAYGAESEPATTGRVMLLSADGLELMLEFTFGGGPGTAVRVADVAFAPDGSLYVLGRATGTFEVKTVVAAGVIGTVQVSVSPPGALFILQLSTTGEVLGDQLFDAMNAEALALEVTADHVYLAARLDDGGNVVMDGVTVDGPGSLIAGLCR